MTVSLRMERGGGGGGGDGRVNICLVSFAPPVVFLIIAVSKCGMRLLACSYISRGHSAVRSNGSYNIRNVY